MLSEKRSKFSIVSASNDEKIISQRRSIVENQHSLHWTLNTSTTYNFTVIWLNLNAEKPYPDLNIDDAIDVLRDVASSFHIFTDSDECIDFITNIIDEEVFLITTNYQIQQIIPLIEDIPELDSIRIFNCDQILNEQWIQQQGKVHGVFTDFNDIISSIRQELFRKQVDLTPFSIVSNTSTSSLDQLDQSFMYTQLIKEIILDIEHDHNARQKFTQFCLKRLHENDFRSQPLNQFEKYYDRHSPIWWYTKEPFVYSTLNKALRIQDTEMMIKMGFFLRDLHDEIKQRHEEVSHTTKMIVYRGQGLKATDVEKIRNNKGGLFAFNSFLSTSMDRKVSLMFAESARQNIDIHGVLFRIAIDPSISSAPFVSLGDLSKFGDEEEILFSMHTVFRIGEMNAIDDRLWEISLSLTCDNDPELKYLTDYLREEIGFGNGWFRLGALMQKMGKFERAMKIFSMLSQTTFDDDIDVDILYQNIANMGVGEVHQMMGHHSKSLRYLEKALEVYRKWLPLDNILFGAIYCNIGLVYRSIANYEMALSYMKKALKIFQKNSPLDYIHMASIYNNIAAIYQGTGKYEMALLYIKKALNIQTVSLPSYHPNLAVNYISMSLIHRLLGDYENGLFYGKKALEILDKSLPSDHQIWAAGYSALGSNYQSLGNYPTALSYFQKALVIQMKSLPHNHPDIITTHKCIGVMKQLTGDLTSGLSNLTEAFEIHSKSISSNQDLLQASAYDTDKLNEYVESFKKGFSHMAKGKQIYSTLASSDQSASVPVNDIIDGYREIIESITKGASDIETALQIMQNSPTINQTWLCGINIDQIDQDQINKSMFNAVSFAKKAFKTEEKPSLSNNSMARYSSNGEYDMEFSMENLLISFSYMAEALEIREKSLPPNDPLVASYYNSFAELICHSGCYQESLPYLEKALGIMHKSLPNNHPLLAKTYSIMANALSGLERYIEASEYAWRAVEIAHSSFEMDQEEIAKYEIQFEQLQYMV